MKTSQRSNSAHQATAKSLGNDRKLCQNALCCKVSYWMPDETKGGRKKKHSLPVCQLPALHRPSFTPSIFRKSVSLTTHHMTVLMSFHMTSRIQEADITEQASKGHAEGGLGIIID